MVCRRKGFEETWSRRVQWLGIRVGLERLAIIGMELPDIRLLWSEDERVQKQLKLGQKYKEVSKFPPVIRDISFIVDTASFSPNDYFDLVRDVIGDMAEEMALIDEYENAEKFGVGKKVMRIESHTDHLIEHSLIQK